MSKVISFRLEDDVYNMLVGCLAMDCAKLAAQSYSYGPLFNPYERMTENQYAQRVLTNVIAKRYIEMKQGSAQEDKKV